MNDRTNSDHLIHVVAKLAVVGLILYSVSTRRKEREDNLRKLEVAERVSDLPEKLRYDIARHEEWNV